MFFFCLRFKNNRRPTVFLFSIFENAPKKVIHSQKRPKWRFWRFDGMMWKLLVYLLVWCGSCCCTCWYDVEAAGVPAGMMWKLLLYLLIWCGSCWCTCWYDVEAAWLLLLPQGVLCPAEYTPVVELMKRATGEQK